MIKWSLLVACVLGTMSGCAATSLNPGASRVMVTRAGAPAGCEYLGSVVGEQGGALTGKYTSNAHLAEGALNDMKNKAFAMGANYVVLEDTQAGSTLSGDRNSVSGQQTDVTHVGNAFRCPVPAASRAPTAGSDGASTTSAATGPRASTSARDVVIVGM
jgi:uncharacterized protein YbjQ (UPF0145 family)